MEQALEKIFNQKFPLCVEFINEHRLSGLLNEFFEFIHGESLHPFERWWPLFLKQHEQSEKFIPLFEIASLEFYKVWAEEMDLGSNMSRESLQLNSSFQSVFIEYASSQLGLGKGLYCVFKKWGPDNASSVIVHKLLAEEALLIDSLSEERKFNEEQLISWMSSHHKNFNFKDAGKNWSIVLEDLISKGILIQSIQSVYS